MRWRNWRLRILQLLPASYPQRIFPDIAKPALDAIHKMNESAKHQYWELQEQVDQENHLLLMNWFVVF
jgi:hypothetical protein